MARKGGIPRQKNLSQKARRFIALREAVGLTQGEAAALAQVKLTTLCRIEQDDPRGDFGMDEVRRLAAVYGRPPGALLDDTGDRTTPPDPRRVTAFSLLIHPYANPSSTLVAEAMSEIDRLNKEYTAKPQRTQDASSVPTRTVTER